MGAAANEEGGDELDEEEEEEAIRNRRVRRSASILSMTSQVGKRTPIKLNSALMAQITEGERSLSLNAKIGFRFP